MSEQLFNSLASIALALVGLALVATILSKNANTANVLSSAGRAFSMSLGAATAPVTGAGGGFTAGYGGFSGGY